MPFEEGRPARCYDAAMRLADAKRWILDLIFPRSCVGCGSEGELLCASCRGGIAFESPRCPVCGHRDLGGLVCDHCGEQNGLRRFFAPFPYRHPLVRKLLHTYKYTGVRDLSPILAGEMHQFLNWYGIAVPPSALLLPVPLHPARESERGFNQSALLARELARQLGVEVCYALRRTRNTLPQAGMTDNARRRENMAGAFAVTNPDAVRGKTVVLVDDVSTSGATLASAAVAPPRAAPPTAWAG